VSNKPWLVFSTSDDFLTVIFRDVVCSKRLNFKRLMDTTRLTLERGHLRNLNGNKQNELKSISIPNYVGSEVTGTALGGKRRRVVAWRLK
jgi:hypothetical protein